MRFIAGFLSGVFFVLNMGLLLVVTSFFLGLATTPGAVPCTFMPSYLCAIPHHLFGPELELSPQIVRWSLSWSALGSSSFVLLADLMGLVFSN